MSHNLPSVSSDAWMALMVVALLVEISTTSRHETETG